MNTNRTIIKLEKISFAYPERPLVFGKFDFEFKQGERIGLIGSNGSGKTTLFHIMMGLLKPIQGRVVAFGEIRSKENDFKEVRERVGLLFQDADDQLFCPTVAEDIAFGPLNLGKTREEVYEIVERTLEILGLRGFGSRVTYNLSGGEKRLVSFATVLAMKPEILLLDEATTGLDRNSTERIIEILNNSNFSYIITSYDREFLERTTCCIYRLNNGKIKMEK